MSKIAYCTLLPGRVHSHCTLPSRVGSTSSSPQTIWQACGASCVGSFGLEVCRGQRKFPGGQNCSRSSLGSRLNWQAQALRARTHSPVVTLCLELASQCSLTPLDLLTLIGTWSITENSCNKFHRSKRAEHNA